MVHHRMNGTTDSQRAREETTRTVHRHILACMDSSAVVVVEILSSKLTRPLVCVHHPWLHSFANWYWSSL